MCWLTLQAAVNVIFDINRLWFAHIDVMSPLWPSHSTIHTMHNPREETRLELEELL